MQKNMTMGNPFLLLTGFVLPIFVGNLFQQLYLMSDTLIVSRLLWVDALAAVGAVSPFSFMVVGFAQGLTMGFTAILSQRFGAGDHEGMRKVYAMSTLLSLVISFLLPWSSLSFPDPCLRSSIHRKIYWIWLWSIFPLYIYSLSSRYYITSIQEYWGVSEIPRVLWYSWLFQPLPILYWTSLQLLCSTWVLEELLWLL